jgi:hypothetical protein
MSVKRANAGALFAPHFNTMCKADFQATFHASPTIGPDVLGLNRYCASTTRELENLFVSLIFHLKREQSINYHVETRLF